MRTFDEINTDARDQPAFSNSDEGYGFMAANCDRCIHDKPARQGDDEAPPVIVNPESVGNLDETPIVRVGPIMARILGPATTGRDKMREGCYGCSSPAPAVCATNCADAQGADA